MGEAYNHRGGGFNVRTGAEGGLGELQEDREVRNLRGKVVNKEDRDLCKFVRERGGHSEWMCRGG